MSRREKRPTKTLFRKICNAVAKGQSINKLCADDSSLPKAETVHKWKREHKDFQAMLIDSCEIAIENLTTEYKDLADTPYSKFLAENEGDKSLAIAFKRDKMAIYKTMIDRMVKMRTLLAEQVHEKDEDDSNNVQIVTLDYSSYEPESTKNQSLT